MVKLIAQVWVIVLGSIFISLITTQHLTKEIEVYKRNFTNINNTLADKSQKLVIYEHHFQLLGLIDNYVIGLEECRMRLQQYCTLKKDEKSLNDKQVATMDSYSSWLGCKEQLEADHYETILPSFNERIHIIYETRKELENMLFVGDFEKMKIAQEKSKNLPSEHCLFLCTKNERDKEADTDLDSIFEPKNIISILSRSAWWNPIDQEDTHV